MRKSLLPALVILAVVGCRDAGSPVSIVAPPTAVRSQTSVGGTSQFLVRADASDPAAAAKLAAIAARQLAVLSSSGGSTECAALLSGVFERIVVPPGATCILVDAVVTHNVDVLQNALLATFATEVGGDVHGHDANVIQLLTNTRVQGNVDHKDGGDPVFFSYLQSEAAVEGNVHVNRNFPDGHILIQLSSVGKNLDVSDNGGSGFGQIVVLTSVGDNFDFVDNKAPGIRSVQANTVGKKLRCSGNDPPMFGGPNTAGKGAEGQCF